ncbi:cupin domain-containing protein [Streptomyces sp. NPDC091259]|uniref:cupin domain-containing protein n=1 Tax=Streptomyces sp. NPDC091259 TaxID=3365976 RepID=UPI0038150B83
MGAWQATARRPRATDASDLIGREIVIAPGECTGWHYHDVPLMAVVKCGTLTRVLHDDTVEVHSAGTTFVEPPGIDHIHLGRNLGTDPVVLQVTCSLAEDAPWSVPTPAPATATPCGCPGHAG